MKQKRTKHVFECVHGRVRVLLSSFVVLGICRILVIRHNYSVLNFVRLEY